MLFRVYLFLNRNRTQYPDLTPAPHNTDNKINRLAAEGGTLAWFLPLYGGFGFTVLRSGLSIYSSTYTDTPL
jgi:hypothetical protein